MLSQTVTANQLSTCGQGIFPNLFPLLKIGCTLPVTSYECEILNDNKAITSIDHNDYSLL